MNIEQLKIELEEYGFVVIRNLIPTETADQMARRLIDLMNAHADAGATRQNLRGVFNYDDQDTFVPLVTNPVYLELAEHLLGPGFQMAEVGSVWVKPGAAAQALHADVPVGWFADSGLPIPDACFLVNCIWMLTDFTRENGATLLLPCSHHSRRVPRPEVNYKHLVAAEGPAGSIVIFHGAIWHGAGANVTRDEQRVGISSGFHAAWMDPAAGGGWHLMQRSVWERMPTRVQDMNKRLGGGIEDD
jgi:ectoine hydroxylase-related dioxygenase (phytanoyl-CoA dioxygenase family)